MHRILLGNRVYVDIQFHYTSAQMNNALRNIIIPRTQSRVKPDEAQCIIMVYIKLGIIYCQAKSLRNKRFLVDKNTFTYISPKLI